MRQVPLISPRLMLWRHPVRCLTVWRLALGLGGVLLTGCEGDNLKPPPPDERALYWRLAMNHHAVTLSMAPTYDTLTLNATPQNVRGDVLAGLPAPTYKSTDVATVRVSTDGVLQAVAANSQAVWVLATVVAGNLRHTDSALVRVVDLATPPVLASFSVHPLAPDSAKTFSEFVDGKNLPLRHSVLPARASDANGTPFDSLVPNGIPVYFRSSDTTIARIDPVTGEVTGLMPGNVILYASTTAFGVSKMDTLPYRIGWPVWNSVGVDTTGFSPSEITIGAGGMVSWQLPLADTTSIDITFSDANALTIGAAAAWPLGHLVNFFGFDLAGLCAFVSLIDCTGAGNIDVVAPGLGSLRTFPVSGIYEYRSTRYGFAGRVIVVDDR